MVVALLTSDQSLVEMKELYLAVAANLADCYRCPRAEVLLREREWPLFRPDPAEPAPKEGDVCEGGGAG